MLKSAVLFVDPESPYHSDSDCSDHSDDDHSDDEVQSIHSDHSKH